MPPAAPPDDRRHRRRARLDQGDASMPLIIGAGAETCRHFLRRARRRDLSELPALRCFSFPGLCVFEWICRRTRWTWSATMWLTFTTRTAPGGATGPCDGCRSACRTPSGRMLTWPVHRQRSPTTRSPPLIDHSFRTPRHRRGSRRLGPSRRSVGLSACRGREGGERSVQQFAEVRFAVARTPLPEDDPQAFERRRYANVGDDR